MIHKTRRLGTTVHFHIAVNDRTGSGDDGANPAAYVRECGADADAAPVLSPTPVLLSDAAYAPGLYEVEFDITEDNGFAMNTEYAVFATVAVDDSNPVGFIGTVYVASAQVLTCEDADGPPGGLTLAKMLSELRMLVRREWPEDARLFTPSLLASWVNMAYQEIDRRLRWTRCEYTFDVVEDQHRYLIPSRVREWLLVVYEDDDGNRYKLAHLSTEEWGTKYSSTSVTSRPTHYVHHGDKLHLHPTPDTSDATVTIYGCMEPLELTGDDDTPAFPAHLHDYIVHLATARAYRFMGHAQEALNIEGFVDTHVAEERREAATERGSSGGIIHEGI